MDTNDENKITEPEELLDAPTMQDLIDQLAETEKQRDEYLNGWQRSKADFVNYKKEETKHLEDIARYGSESIIKDLLSLLNVFDLAIQDLYRKAAPNQEIELLRSQLFDVLKKRGVEKIELNSGDMFDPATAEAMMEVVALGPPGSIVEIMESGYKLHEKVLRAAKVSISKDK